MTTAKKIRKSMFALLIALVFTGLSIFPAFMKTKAVESTGLTELSNRETVVYPSAKTTSVFMSATPSKNAMFYANKDRVTKNVAKIYKGNDGNGTDINSAALCPDDGIGEVGAIETPDALDATLLSKDYDITWVISAPGKSLSGWDYADAFTFFNNPTYQSNPKFCGAGIGIYNKNFSDNKYEQKALSNSIAVEIDNFNDCHELAGVGDSGKMDELWTETDENGADLPGGKDIPRKHAQQAGHVAITIPEESKKAKDPTNAKDWANRENDGVRLPHYSARLMNDSYQGGRALKRRLHTVRIKWQLADPGKTDSVKDNTYRLTYYMYNGQNQCLGVPVTGKKDFTYEQLRGIMCWSEGDTEGKAKMAIWGSTAPLVGMSRRHYFPKTYNYTIKYIDKKTRKPLKEEYKSTAPLGLLTVRAPQIEGYRLVSKSPVDKNISAWGKNNIVFYYEPLKTDDTTRPTRPHKPGNNNKRPKIDFSSFFGNCKKRPVVQKMANGKKGKAAVKTGFGLSAAAFGVVFALSGGALAIASKKRND